MMVLRCHFDISGYDGLFLKSSRGKVKVKVKILPITGH